MPIKGAHDQGMYTLGRIPGRQQGEGVDPARGLALLSGNQFSIHPKLDARHPIIVTGERTFLEYLSQPILDSLRRSFRES